MASTSETFAGKSALITGAARGIGREIARQLSAAGAHVTASDLPGAALDSTRDDLGVDALPIDVSSREQIEAGI